MASLTNPSTLQTVTVPDEVAESYLSRGWVRPGTPTPAEPEQAEAVPDAVEGKPRAAKAKGASETSAASTATE